VVGASGAGQRCTPGLLLPLHLHLLLLLHLLHPLLVLLCLAEGSRCLGWVGRMWARAG
jgi:hypothetical protein